MLASRQILSEWPYRGMGYAHSMWTRISVLNYVAGKPERESPLIGTKYAGKDNIKMIWKKE
jgi:hypothetical protein